MGTQTMPPEQPVILQHLKSHGLFVILLIAYLVAAVAMSFYLPAFSGPNERLHYEYIALMRRTHKLPDPSTSLRADERHQPPLYYTIATLASLPFPEPLLDTELTGNPFYGATHRGNLNPIVHATPRSVPIVYVARFVSTLFGALGLLGVYVAAYQSLPKEASLLITSLVAFQPTYLHLSATINNDLAVTAVGTWLIALTTILILRGAKPHAFLCWGILFACAMLTKANAVFLVSLLPIACWAIWRSLGRLWPAVQCGLWGIGGAIPILGTWFFVNQLRGQDVMGIGQSLPLDRVFRQNPGDWIHILPHLDTLWRSFWLDWSPGERGYAPSWFYLLWGLMLAIALAGWLRRRSKLGRLVALSLMHLCAVATLTALFLAVKALMVKEAGFLVPEGRWLLPALPSFAWLVGVGWGRWWPKVTCRRACLLATSLPMVAAFLLMVLFLPGLYPRAQRLADADRIPSSAHAVGLTYDGQIELLVVQSEPLTIDRESDVTLYWKALRTPEADYAVSVQLLVPDPSDWDRLDWQNSYPGNGLTPTRSWQQDDIYRDRIILYPQGILNGPSHAILGVWLLENSVPLPVESDGQEVELPIAQEVTIYPAEPVAPSVDSRLTTPVSFGGLFDLVGISYSYGPAELEVALWWQAQTDVPADYVTFVHLVDSEGHLVAQDDTMPDHGRSPTHLWRSGDGILDVHRLDTGVPPDTTLWIGAYDPTTVTRLPATQGQQPLPDHVFRLRLP
jgi:hypothetical protein